MDLKQSNRFSVSFGFKSTVGKFQTADVHVSFASDEKPNELLDEHFQRVIGEAEKRFETALNSMREMALSRKKAKSSSANNTQYNDAAQQKRVALEKAAQALNNPGEFF